MTKYEKTNTPNIVIDRSTGVALNTDVTGYEAIKNARIERRKAQALEDRIFKLENDVMKLKEMIGKAQ